MTAVAVAAGDDVNNDALLGSSACEVDGS